MLKITLLIGAGKKRGAQDILMYIFVGLPSGAYRIDFGASTEREGQHLSNGRANYREGFEGRTTSAHDFFIMELKLT